MPSFKPGKRDIDKLLDILSPEEEVTMEEVAKQVFEHCWNAYEAKAKYAVVGQVYDVNGRRVHTSDDEAVKVCLYPYSTPTQAKNAVPSLKSGAASPYMLRCWVVPIHNGTPASFHKDLKVKAVVHNDREFLAQQIADEEAARVASQWCRHVDMREDDMALVECRRQHGHPGEHGLWSTDLGGMYVSSAARAKELADDEIARELAEIEETMIDNTTVTCNERIHNDTFDLTVWCHLEKGHEGEHRSWLCQRTTEGAGK